MRKNALFGHFMIYWDQTFPNKQVLDDLSQEKTVLEDKILRASTAFGHVIDFHFLIE